MVVNQMWSDEMVVSLLAKEMAVNLPMQGMVVGCLLVEDMVIGQMWEHEKVVGLLIEEMVVYLLVEGIVVRCLLVEEWWLVTCKRMQWWSIGL